MGEDEAIRQELADVITPSGWRARRSARPMSGSRCRFAVGVGLHRP